MIVLKKPNQNKQQQTKCAILSLGSLCLTHFHPWKATELRLMTAPETTGWSESLSHSMLMADSPGCMQQSPKKILSSHLYTPGNHHSLLHKGTLITSGKEHSFILAFIPSGEAILHGSHRPKADE